MKNQWELKLNETMFLGDDDYCIIRRVPGGWIYSEYDPVNESTDAMVFVPYIESEK